MWGMTVFTSWIFLVIAFAIGIILGLLIRSGAKCYKFLNGAWFINGEPSGLVRDQCHNSALDHLRRELGPTGNNDMTVRIYFE